MCINLSVNQSVSQSFSQSVFQFVCQFVSRSVFVCLSVCHSVCFDRARSALFSFFFFSAFLGSSSEGNQRRQSPIEYRGNLYLFKSALMSVRSPPWPSGASLPVTLRGWTDRQMYGHTDSPYILQDFVYSCSLWSCCPAHTTANATKYQSRARAPMTISCLWATAFFSFIFHLFPLICFQTIF